MASLSRAGPSRCAALCPANRAAVLIFASLNREINRLALCCTRGFLDNVITSMAAMPPSFMNCFWLSSPIARLANAATASVSQYASPLLAMSISGFNAPASTILRPFSSCKLSSDAAFAAKRATSKSCIIKTSNQLPIRRELK